MSHPMRWLPLLLLAGCRPDPASALFLESRTEQGLLRRPRELAMARAEHLEAETPVFFGSAIVPASASRLHATGRLTVAQGKVELDFTDAQGQVQRVAASPGAPGNWDADLRALRPREGRNGFLVKLRPQGAPARQVRLEIAYRPG